MEEARLSESSSDRSPDPGNAEDVITVGATHRNRPFSYGVSYFSSRGPELDVVAPGGDIRRPEKIKDVVPVYPAIARSAGISGTVIDVQVFTREGIERDKRSQSIIEDELKRYKTDLADQMRIVESDTFERLERLLTNKTANGGPKRLAKGTKVTKEYLATVEVRIDRGSAGGLSLTSRAKRSYAASFQPP